MEVGLSAVTLYLASASSPAAATMMDREPVNREEGGEAVGVCGAAAASAFRESSRQVGGAAQGCRDAEAEARRAQPPVCLVHPQLLACPAFLVAGRPPGVRFETPLRGIPASAPSICLREGADVSAVGSLLGNPCTDSPADSGVA